MAFGSEESKKIKAELIIEVLGKPAEHLTETLGKIIEEIDKEKGVCVLSKKIHEPQPIKEQKDFFTNFAEIEVETEGILYLVMLVFKYMPSNIDIVSPEELKITNNNLNETLNEITRRLHGYDEVARVVQAEKKILEKRLRELLEEKNKK